MIRSHGHRFSAIRRTKLLGILQRRARELGVELRFEQDVQDLGELPDADLLVGADGINSLGAAHARAGVRARPRRLPHALRVVRHRRRARRVHVRVRRDGARRLPGARLSVRRAHEHVHRRDAGGHWRRAGLDALSEPESLAFCRELFAPVLDGHELLSNRSVWLAFNELRCKDWSAGATVLLGDAAHTAHFSIGSGTKLAIEDAIELAAALGRPTTSPTRWSSTSSSAGPWWSASRRRRARAPSTSRRSRATGGCRRCSSRSTCSPAAGASATPTSRCATRGSSGGWTRSSAAAGALAPPPLFAPLELDGLTLANRAVVRGLDDRVGAGLYLSPARRGHARRADHARRPGRPRRLARRRRGASTRRAAPRCSRC